jgi:hypothetical protein
LDSDIVALPGRSLKSFLGLFAHLENLSKGQNLACHSVLKQLEPARAGASSAASWAEAALRERVNYRELGRQVIRAAQGQVRSLQQRLEEVKSLVLINDWAVAERLWSDMVPECKTPLFEMSLLEELWGVNPDQFQVGGWTLTRQWHEFVLLQAQFEILLGRRRSLVEFSDALERELGGWLSWFGDLLEKLDEASAT